ncbi:hypothetical protein CHISP_1584 [Chitinispirillum alkaliphilum]|nr:hypothetical protein CHISP_1584 [Chitinispirillum alkaliphilum]
MDLGKALVKSISAFILIGAVMSFSYADEPDSLTADTSFQRNTENSVTLNITTRPSEATISLNGTNYGTSPVTITDLDTGTYVLDVSKTGHFRRRVRVRAEAYGERDIFLELQKPATLLITSEPAGAEILIADRQIGTTPLDEQIRPGHYSITLILEGYHPAQTETELVGGKRDSLHITLEPVRESSPEQESAVKKSEITEQEISEPTKPARKRNIFSSIAAGAFILFGVVIFGIEKSSN